MRGFRIFDRLPSSGCPIATSVVSGLLNKQVGGELGISKITVKAHRGQVMRKMKADALPDLVRMAARHRSFLPNLDAGSIPAAAMSRRI